MYVIINIQHVEKKDKKSNFYLKTKEWKIPTNNSSYFVTNKLAKKLLIMYQSNVIKARRAY